MRLVESQTDRCHLAVRFEAHRSPICDLHAEDVAILARNVANDEDKAADIRAGQLRIVVFSNPT